MTLSLCSSATWLHRGLWWPPPTGHPTQEGQAGGGGAADRVRRRAPVEGYAHATDTRRVRDGPGLPASHRSGQLPGGLFTLAERHHVHRMAMTSDRTARCGSSSTRARSIASWTALWGQARQTARRWMGSWSDGDRFSAQLAMGRSGGAATGSSLGTDGPGVAIKGSSSAGTYPVGSMLHGRGGVVRVGARHGLHNPEVRSSSTMSASTTTRPWPPT